MLLQQLRHEREEQLARQPLRLRWLLQGLSLLRRCRNRKLASPLEVRVEYLTRLACAQCSMLV